MTSGKIHGILHNFSSLVLMLNCPGPGFMNICAAFSAPIRRLIVHLQTSYSESSITGACSIAVGMINPMAALTGTKWTLQQGITLSHAAVGREPH